MSEESRPPIRLSYLICTTPRSGSNFLCEVLSSTGVAGRPDEYFWNPPAGHAKWGVPEWSAYVEQIRRAGTTPNGIFGIKLMWSYFGEVVGRLVTLPEAPEGSPPEILEAVFPQMRYVWLTRRDKVRQAISWFRAVRTERWRSMETGVMNDEAVAFDFEPIDGLTKLAAADDQSWQAFFAQYGIEPLTIVYEEWEHDPLRACRQILDLLGVSAPERDAPPAWRHQRQSDGLTEEWVRRYHALKAGPAR